MVCDYVKPSGFVQKNETVEVLFMEEDAPKWYKGTVTDINHYGKDAFGYYVECAVLYDDGEFVADSRFYDCDFNNPESTDSWRFPSALTGVLTILDKTRQDIDLLKKKQKMSFEAISEEEDDEDYEDEEDDEAEEDQEDEEEQPEPSPKRPRSTFLIGLSILLITGLFMKRAYLNYVLVQCMNQYSSVQDAIAAINTLCFHNIKSV